MSGAEKCVHFGIPREILSRDFVTDAKILHLRVQQHIRVFTFRDILVFVRYEAPRSGYVPGKYHNSG